MLDLYYGLQDMDDYEQMYEFIFDKTTRDEREPDLSMDEKIKIVHRYMSELEETIDATMQFFCKLPKTVK